ncbi:Z-ring formation inhibitor MciZ [Rossellomorea aquimaris]|nr:Z-ring formation inhibitor MciZ [Rossellomorea aquimaris]
MKIITKNDRIILIGKAWEIREKLKEYNQSFETVKQWIDSIQQRKT